MTLPFLLRLLLDALAAGLLAFGLAYYWLGNLPHELAGGGLFGLVILHNLFNRRWYGALGRGRQDGRRRLNILVTALLVLVMSALLVTSLLISQTLSGYLPFAGGFTARQLHALAGWWGLIIVALHLGLRWMVIQRVAANLLGISKPHPLRTWGLRLVAATVALLGIRSALLLGIAPRLGMQMSLDWWDFSQSVAGFFLHLGAVAGLCVFLGHYLALLVQCRRPPQVAR